MKITVFDVGRGSSVLVELPPLENSPAQVGIVDCYCGQRSLDPLFKRLEEVERNSTKGLSIEFFVITHFHADHFLGLGDIVKRFGDRIKRLLDPGIDPREIMMAEFYRDEPYDGRVRKELKTLATFKKNYRERVFSITTPGLEIFACKARGIVVRSLAPDGLMLDDVRRSLSSYIATLMRAYRQGGQDKVLTKIGRLSARGYDLNKTSSAIEISYRGNKIVLGGDVLSRSWKTILDGTTKIHSDVFLLSHHGSSNAFPISRWKEMHKESGAVIVSGRGLGQPAPSVLNHLRRSRTKVWATNIPEKYSIGNASHLYVTKIHYGADSELAAKQGDVVCSLSESATVAGPCIW